MRRANNTAVAAVVEASAAAAVAFHMAGVVVEALAVEDALAAGVQARR
jgi:hypothetical protein